MKAPTSIARPFLDARANRSRTDSRTSISYSDFVFRISSNISSLSLMPLKRSLRPMHSTSTPVVSPTEIILFHFPHLQQQVRSAETVEVANIDLPANDSVGNNLAIQCCHLFQSAT